MLTPGVRKKRVGTLRFIYVRMITPITRIKMSMLIICILIIFTLVNTLHI